MLGASLGKELFVGTSQRKGKGDGSSCHGPRRSFCFAVLAQAASRIPTGYWCPIANGYTCNFETRKAQFVRVNSFSRPSPHFAFEEETTRQLFFSS
ncbi:hypothetical protein BDP81DRAFT_443594 [Colletotrichum phormii]|uniref:Uncharacterized protein n=1 Tax=Colletotrichum phormii TaxID=359342 RepID=A0AAI9ZDI1_9PEZI|nr:uncharacterized protein BDP81DRAFT_443594 [Colletotrichum phormii]KAK1621444.1 hypothetical protein BDP81DRAFT_443594 [Colletotrichum phormii]